MVDRISLKLILLHNWGKMRRQRHIEIVIIGENLWLASGIKTATPAFRLFSTLLFSLQCGKLQKTIIKRLELTPYITHRSIDKPMFHHLIQLISPCLSIQTAFMQMPTLSGICLRARMSKCRKLFGSSTSEKIRKNRLPHQVNIINFLVLKGDW